MINKFISHYSRDNKLLLHPILYAAVSLKIKQATTQDEHIHVYSSHGDNLEKPIGAQIQ
jgi:hypothetical protein